jgi:DNA-binding transcriptional MerR regulator
MRSGMLASLSGVSADTLRHYERLGILPIPQRSAANYRDFPAASVQRVKLTRDFGRPTNQRN